MRKVKYILFWSTLLVSASIQAQNYNDAMRYSTEELTGTARFKGMSGAFGALGGDLSAFNINPAGSAVFNTSEISVSLNSNRQKRDITFFDRNNTITNNDFNVNHFGFVIPITDVSPTVKKISLGFNYLLSKTLDNDKFSYSAFTNKGLDNYFSYYATQGNAGNPFSFDTFATGYNYKPEYQQQEIGEYYARLGRTNGYAAQMAYLGMMANLITPSNTTPNNTSYDVSGNNLERLETYRVDRTGYVNKYNFNISSQLGDYIYLGLNLNGHNINEKALYSVKDDNFQGTNPFLTYANHKQYINTTGEGFSLQLGSIIKVNDDFRVGVSYQSPTWYSLKEESRQVLYGTVVASGKEYNSDIELVNRYNDPIWYEREYKFRTPSAWTASAAYIIKKRAILSADYTYRAYDNLKFRSANMQAENNIIQNELGDTSTLRLGAEYRIPFKLLKEEPSSKNFVSLRAGYRYEQSPYRKAIATVGDLNGYSFGGGVSLGGIRLDLSYDIAKQTNLFQMYETVLTDNAKINSKYGNFLLTFTAQLF
ncbi:OmpP1/FadL family transporter [Capnocytophaga sp. oral taxon 878]|uniref:OmpP1/FadL family transporter n=1 Tax=Capnocytophaga sp. oral taxon 878 TaxID=1316596 RepID=UPI000D039753|nr:outer membrane protein transport protein [Capnocytophaga sp. oral taxon 878]AVM49095.1 hypothetical protein C4H12_00635 [Capnocytophaga sp. oral taxon 878]